MTLKALRFDVFRSLSKLIDEARAPRFISFKPWIFSAYRVLLTVPEPDFISFNSWSLNADQVWHGRGADIYQGQTMATQRPPSRSEGKLWQLSVHLRLMGLEAGPGGLCAH